MKTQHRAHLTTGAPGKRHYKTEKSNAVFDFQDEPWMEKAACKDAPKNTFFAINYGRGGSLSSWNKAYLDNVRETYCFQCPVMNQCFDYAVKTRSVGIWGGWLFSDATGRGDRTNLAYIRRLRDKALSQYRRFGKVGNGKEPMGFVEDFKTS